MINLFKLLLGVSCLVFAQGNSIHPCTSSGFFPLVDNSAEFYACDENPNGGYSLRYLRCQEGSVFNAEQSMCVENLSLAARDNGNIENPTIPPSHLDESTPTEKPADQTTTATPIISSTEPVEIDSSSVVTDSDDSSSSPVTKDDNDSSSSAVTSDDNDSSSSAVTGDDNDSSSSAVTKDDNDSSSSAVTKDDNDSSSSAVTGDDDSSSSAVTGDDDKSSSAVTNDGSTSPEPEDDQKSTREDNICATSGFQPKDGNCSQYVYCEDKGTKYQAYYFDCPEGMQYNPAVDYCVLGYDCTK